MKKQKLGILIVDDNSHFVERISAMLAVLHNIDYINVASDYEEACRMLKSEAPDLVILDINLPGRNGMEILSAIKESGQQCEVIVLSNHADEYYREQCKLLGAKYFFDKSNEFGKVTGVVSRHRLN